MANAGRYAGPARKRGPQVVAHLECRLEGAAVDEADCRAAFALQLDREPQHGALAHAQVVRQRGRPPAVRGGRLVAVRELDELVGAARVQADDGGRRDLQLRVVAAVGGAQHRRRDEHAVREAVLHTGSSGSSRRSTRAASRHWRGQAPRAPLTASGQQASERRVTHPERDSLVTAIEVEAQAVVVEVQLCSREQAQAQVARQTSHRRNAWRAERRGAGLMLSRAATHRR